MAGITHGAEWIEVARLRELIGQLPAEAMVQASPLGNLVVYDARGPVDGEMIAYIDLLTETLEFDDAGPDEPAPRADAGAGAAESARGT